jgi:hypothetical protein
MSVMKHLSGQKALEKRYACTNATTEKVESKIRRPMLRMDLRIFGFGFMLLRRRPLGERAGQSLDCPSELIQIICIIRAENNFLKKRKKILLFKFVNHFYKCTGLTNF